MHVPKRWQMGDHQKICQFIQQHPFALLVSPNLDASHIPLLLHADEGSQGVLYGHLSRANKHWQQIQNSQALAVFSGPHSYISPRWYQSQPGVPTWNYAAVHCKGSVELLQDEQTLAFVRKLTKHFETVEDTSDALADYEQKLLKGIVGFKLVIDHIDAQEKLGQHKNAEDQQGVVKGLEQDQHPDAAGLLHYMQQTGVGLGQ